ncbi:hypothetical protein FUAX_39420 (plasmid) [Fulvitalea axinellae]|uniref:F5/8 type C domain-containing protein n=1 Tax=Fulvitalea axinellae TaxID=1182444 RepID=A0AAU9CQ46_9BACT|nr:hypothetical protein FUAX_39420 [Fulvitalea axinellae]
MKRIYQNIYKFVLFGATGIFLACAEDTLDLKAPSPEIYDTKPLHLINDVSQYWNPQLFGEGNNFFSFLDTANAQFMTLSYPKLSKIDATGRNVLNVYLNTENNESYTPEDIAYLTKFSEKRSLCFFAMGDGAELANPNDLVAGFGFAFEAGPVGDITTMKEGHTVKASNKGSFLRLDTPEEWTILAKSGETPVIAVKGIGNTLVLASGIDIFSGFDAGNVAFFKEIMKDATTKSPAFFSSEYISVLDYGFAQREGHVTYKANTYFQSKVLDVKQVYETVLEDVKQYLDRDDGSRDWTLRLMGGNGILTKNAGEYYLGIGASDFAGNTEKLSVELGKCAYHWVNDFKVEPFDQDALALYTIVKILEEKGVADAREKYIRPLVDFAKGHTDFQAYDPLTMSSEQLGMYPRELGLGKMLATLEQIEETHGADAVTNFVEHRKTELPNGLDQDPNNNVWALGTMTEDVDAAFELFVGNGYGVDFNKRTIPGTYEGERIPASELTVISSPPAREGKPDYIVDGDVNSKFHTNWDNSTPPMPHDIVVDMGEQKEVAYFVYHTRQDQNDQITKCYLYVSDDPDNWGDPVAEYRHEGEANKDPVTGETNKGPKSIYAYTFKKGRYVKLAIHEFKRGKNETKYSSVNELEIYSYKGPLAEK